MNNLLFRIRNNRFYQLYANNTHLLRDCLNALALILGKQRKMVSAVDGVLIGDRMNRIFIDIVDHGDVSLTFATSILIDADAWHHFYRLSRFPPSNSFIQDVPCILPTGF